MLPPLKPFPEYKWRWAVYTPTESLNEPSLFLGVLRALRNCEGLRPNSPELIHALRIVQEQTHSRVNLVRNEERNIIRNSGQYWRALNLLESSRGGILLTPFGQNVADGNITPTEFAITVIKTLGLPNPLIESKEEISLWGTLRIKPLDLILKILASLQHAFGMEQAYLTPYELKRIVIPLAGISAPINQHVEAIFLFRGQKLDLSGWPNCTPESNDRRMAREFLLFLANYNICELRMDDSGEERYYLNFLASQDIASFDRIDVTGLAPQDAYLQVRESNLINAVERQRIQVTTFARPSQAQFRQNILIAYHSTCVVTGVRLPAVIEAAHIIPIPNNGSDLIENGLCLRADIHRMFDTGHLRIDTNGFIHLSESAALAHNYGTLPERIEIPPFVSRENINWRWQYT